MCAAFDVGQYADPTRLDRMSGDLGHSQGSASGIAVASELVPLLAIMDRGGGLPVL